MFDSLKILIHVANVLYLLAFLVAIFPSTKR